MAIEKLVEFEKKERFYRKDKGNFVGYYFPNFFGRGSIYIEYVKEKSQKFEELVKVLYDKVKNSRIKGDLFDLTNGINFAIMYGNYTPLLRILDYKKDDLIHIVKKVL